MATIKLDRSQYTVLPDAENLPDEAREAFYATKLRLENLIGAEIDIESAEGKERFNYAVFKAVTIRMYENLDDPQMPRHVANAVRKLLSEMNTTFEFRSPFEALSFQFPNGLTLIESLYECGYFDCAPTKRKQLDAMGKPVVIDPKKNVESIEKISKAYDLPEIEPFRQNALRIAGCLNRVIEADGSPSMDCRIASLRLYKALTREGGMDPNEIVGSFDESAFHLMAKYAVDPRNYEPLMWAMKSFRAIFSEFDPSAKYLRVINPYVVDRKGVTILDSMRSKSREASRYVDDDAMLDAAFRRTAWLLSELESDWNLITEANLDSPTSRKLRETYRA